MRSGRQRCLGLTAALLLAACQGEAPSAVPAGAATRPPNILFVLIDDMGYADLGANGDASVSTPNLDSLAARGVRFTRNYVDSTCAATRAGILSGQPPARLGFRSAGLGLSPELQTLPELLRQAGYSTHHIGKWHLGHSTRLAWPLAQGFDTFFGFLSPHLLRGPHRQGRLAEGRPTYRKPWLQEGNQFPRHYRGHLSDLLLERGRTFLRDSAQSEQPWFLNYWMYLPHTPLQPAPRFAAGYPDTPAGRYLAMLEQLDAVVGELLRALEDSGQAHNTLVFVASDNGGTARTRPSNAPFAGRKMTFLEGGVRVPLLIRWPDDYAAGTVYSGIVSYLDYLPTLLAVAGAPELASGPGRDIRQRMAGLSPPVASLHWDTGTSEGAAWAVLADEGDWRLSRFFLGEPQLNDLRRDPHGGRNVAAQHPELVSRLHRQHLTWRHRQRRVDVSFEASGQQGHGLLRGQSLQRAPGFGGWSFALGFEPRPAAQQQVIARQPGQWQLLLESGVFRFEVGTLALEAPAPPAGRCVSLVAAAEVRRGPAMPQQNGMTLELFIDGLRVASKSVADLPELRDNYLEATYLGRDESGARRFLGRLGRPLLFNERLLAEEEKDPWIENGVAAVSEDLCPL